MNINIENIKMNIKMNINIGNIKNEYKYFNYLYKFR